MILPLYAVLEKLDRSLLEAAQDLGANRLRTFLRSDPAALRAGAGGGLGCWSSSRRSEPSLRPTCWAVRAR